MNALFEWLSGSLAAHVPTALFAALLWGLASVALSPCHLASVPIAVAFLRRDERKSPLTISLALALGVVASVAVIGAVTLAAGRIAGDLWGIGPWLAAGALFFAGLYLLDVLEVPTSVSIDQERIPKNTKGALIVGLFLGLTLGPCTFAFFAPVFATAFGEPAAGPLVAALLVAAFTLGHALAVTTAGLFGLRLQSFIARTGALRKAAGVVLLTTSLYLVATAA